MIDRDDLRFLAGILIGATSAAAVVAGFGASGAFLGGALVTGIVCWRALSRQTLEREAAELALRAVTPELVSAWNEADTLRHRLADASPTRPQISDLSRSARSQEPPPCSSATS